MLIDSCAQAAAPQLKALRGAYGIRQGRKSQPRPQLPCCRSRTRRQHMWLPACPSGTSTMTYGSGCSITST